MAKKAKTGKLEISKKPGTGRALEPIVLPASHRGGDSGGAVDDLLSGKVLAKSGGREAKSKKKAKPVEKLPKEIGELSDVLVAGRKIERELSFKIKYADKQVKDYCLRRFAEHYSETGHRPESMTYEGKRGVFSFVQTRRISLTTEKVEALKLLNLNLDGETELKGLHINFDAIREHRLESKLRDALSEMGVSKSILQECFQPDVELKESFFEHLSVVVERSLSKGEKLSDKMYEVLQILDPSSQIRNADMPGLNAVQSYKLVHDADVVKPDTIESLDD
jgi:hypothetical protein